MTKINLIKKVREEIVKEKKEYMREGFTSCARVEAMHIFIDHIVAIEVAAFIKADLLSNGSKIGIMTDAGITVWVSEDSCITVV